LNNFGLKLIRKQQHLQKNARMNHSNSSKCNRAARFTSPQNPNGAKGNDPLEKLPGDVGPDQPLLVFHTFMREIT